jgi:glycosyltransferase involved in cell wall biosynthesis
MNIKSLPKTALVHHWLVRMRGGERVLEALADLFPGADIFTLVCDRERMAKAFPGHRIHTSPLQRLPFATRWYPHYLPLFPWAIQHLDLRGYPLVISSDAAALKGVRTDPGAIHVCYCHTPMRYVWSGYETYRRTDGRLARAALPALAPWLRRWDHAAAQRVTHFVANSQTVAERIRRYYGRASTVIYPPVDTDYFQPALCESRDDFFLVVSQLVPYKRVDLALEAFNRCGKRLLVIGEGSERPKLGRRARPNIRFLGAQPRSVLREAMQHARALIFPGEEDFGIVMAEALACGTPVVAFRRGGASEIVAESETGVLFEDQAADSLLGGVARLESLRLEPREMRNSAARSSRQRFLEQFISFLDGVLAAEPSPAAKALTGLGGARLAALGTRQ